MAVPPQELTMEAAGSPDNHIVRANGIPRRGMSPLHLLGSLEDQIDCHLRQLDNLDGSLSNIVMLTKKSMQTNLTSFAL
jgi:hypothetical protein